MGREHPAAAHRLHPHPRQIAPVCPDWEQQGLLDTVVRNAAAWIEDQKVAGLTLEVVRLPGRTPVLFFEIAATRAASPRRC